MNREILFRGKRKDTKTWVYGYYKSAYGKAWISVCCEDVLRSAFVDYEVLPESVGQFTGLYYKKNNKIFEGDIFRDEQGEMTIIYIRDLYFQTLIQYVFTEDTLIGNATDNPELVED